VQYVLNGGGIPVGVVSSPDKAELLHDLGCAAVIDRAAGGYRFWKDAHTQDESEWRRFGRDVRAVVGEDPDIVFEHPGRQTMGPRSSVEAERSSAARRRRATWSSSTTGTSG
jgi:crotonyl-CoA reductase